MRIPFKAAIAVPLATMAAAGVVAFSAGPASAASHGRQVAQNLTGGCAASLYCNSSTKWAYTRASMYSYGWTCRGFVKNSHGSKSWTSKTAGESWSGGVWRGSGYKAQACVYAYYNNHYKSWACTKWY
jgi:hypothetical protein